MYTGSGGLVSVCLCRAVCMSAGLSVPVFISVEREREKERGRAVPQTVCIGGSERKVWRGDVLGALLMMGATQCQREYQPIM